MKRKLYFWAKKHINNENVKLALMLVPLVVILVQQISNNQFEWSSFFDVGILVTFLLLVLSDFIVNSMQKMIAKNTEDQAKVTNDYESLVKRYNCMNLVEYQGIVLPEECLCMRTKEEEIVFADEPETFYELPGRLSDHAKKLMEAHSASNIYNQINIRLDDLKKDEEQGRIVLHTSRTQYFDSLMTNRCCDYVYEDGTVTIRDFYEPGPFLKPLRLSQFSNHLGFNGFVITKDGKIPFIYRKDSLSIAKHTWATSIGASLKAKYALDSENGYSIRPDSFGKAIVGEIKDELRISDDSALTVSNAQDSIFAFYRDLVEAGKPQFLFVLQLNERTAVEVETGIKAKQKRKDKKNDMSTDGDRVAFFSIEELREAKLEVDKMTVAGKEYVMMPSVVVSIVLLLKYLEEKDRD